jgi:hypothetical protein
MRTILEAPFREPDFVEDGTHQREVLFFPAMRGADNRYLLAGKPQVFRRTREEER